MNDIYKGLAKLGIKDFASLEKEAKKMVKSLSEEDKRELRKAFRDKMRDDSFRDMVEDSYDELQESFKHESDS